MLRRDFLYALMAAGAVTLAGRRIGAAADTAPVNVAAPLSIDLHSHAWRQNGFAGAMRQGGMSVAVLSAVSDRPLINLKGIPTGTPPFNNYVQIPAIVQALVETGFKPEDVQKIMGGNFMRVFKSA